MSYVLHAKYLEGEKAEKKTGVFIKASYFFTIWTTIIIIIVQVLFFPARPIYFSRFYYLPSQFYYFIVIFFCIHRYKTPFPTWTSKAKTLDS